jgi:hypothetical protein
MFLRLPLLACFALCQCSDSQNIDKSYTGTWAIKVGRHGHRTSCVLFVMLIREERRLCGGGEGPHD